MMSGEQRGKMMIGSGECQKGTRKNEQEMRRGE
jgi:hypothetical protein